MLAECFRPCAIKAFHDSAYHDFFLFIFNSDVLKKQNFYLNHFFYEKGIFISSQSLLKIVIQTLR